MLLFLGKSCAAVVFLDSKRIAAVANCTDRIEVCSLRHCRPCYCDTGKNFLGPKQPETMGVYANSAEDTGVLVVSTLQVLVSTRIGGRLL